ncbi:bifunctional response regulator/alkaline phosphatase family protein [bacterium]|nr:bifunctional response regulator/alkaline phosphatase family protein [bacterium]NUN44043.1 PglZ domain-containing protein [bacterium]HMW34303.1 bifunctional response regulator/alkaline phosphatase family protein [bacterium]HMW35277.1 bifunctional response regulator/alkaline phosphatase family protein [bacterium]HMZ04853.1 bifunctional response regulator/alkaline phosphatase family protein [bacterium]
MQKKRIIWADDEIELLKPHILFLEQRGYEVTPVTNGEDAISQVRTRKYDLVLLDEMMDGKDGLTTLEEIKENSPTIPVVMITKSEEERLMEDAIGRKIDFYLTKPVNPSQILMACKQIFESRKLTEQKISRDYVQEFNRISQKLMDRLEFKDWYDIAQSMAEWEVELDALTDTGLRQMLEDQRKACNVEFGKFVEKNYHGWVNSGLPQRPEFSVDIVRNYVFPKIAARRKVVFIVIDCLRIDQWLGFESVLQEYFNINKKFYYSILPTSTPYSRNAIFSGMWPSEIEQKFPDIWSKGEEDDSSRNRFEKELLEYQLKSNRVPMETEAKYVKILNAEHSRQLETNITSFVNSSQLTAIVLNFLDILAHTRSDSHVIKEIAPHEPAYRSLSNSWFTHSSFLEILKTLSRLDCQIVITSDHGSIRSLHGTEVIGDKETSTSLRYKYGKNIKSNPKHSMFIKNPLEYKLPKRGVNTHYIIAKEDYYFLYPTNYHHFLNHYNDTFQHGGISVEEVIMPVIEMEGKR